MNRRLRKKKRVGEFVELGFNPRREPRAGRARCVRGVHRRARRAFIESRRLCLGGGGPAGRVPSAFADAHRARLGDRGRPAPSCWPSWLAGDARVPGRYESVSLCRRLGRLLARRAPGRPRRPLRGHAAAARTQAWRRLRPRRARRRFFSGLYLAARPARPAATRGEAEHTGRQVNVADTCTLFSTPETGRARSRALSPPEPGAAERPANFLFARRPRRGTGTSSAVPARVEGLHRKACAMTLCRRALPRRWGRTSSSPGRNPRPRTRRTSSA